MNIYKIPTTSKSVEIVEIEDESFPSSASII
jgi:hypothetical protein